MILRTYVDIETGELHNLNRQKDSFIE